jgi:sigma-B regulation protein RsbU (phosphoserine phosphatase)
MEKKRVSVRQKLLRIMLSLFAVAMLLTGLVGIISMQLLRLKVQTSDRALGETAAEDSKTVLLSQMEQSLQDIVSAKANLADARLGKYSSFVSSFADYIDSLYRDADTVPKTEVLPPDKKNGGVLTMQRTLKDESVRYQDVAAEASLLGNVQRVFDPVIRGREATVATVYLGTENGLMLSYDTNSDTANNGDGESYYDFQSSDWYKGAKDAGKVIFTDTYADSFGRGLTVTCAAPFYKTDGTFAGVVAMDILISDLNKEIINIDLGSGTYAVLINRKGEIIASPYMSNVSDKLQNVNSEDSPMRSVADQVMSGKTGFLQASDNVYYAYTPVISADWTFAIHIPSSKITSSSDQVKSAIAETTDATEKSIDRQILSTITTFVIIFAIIMLAIVYLLQKFTGRLTAPVIALKKDVEEISAGDIDHQAVIRDNDEVGDLAQAFNDMTANLKKYIHDLTAVTAEKERIGAELNVAKQIQADMLPNIFPPYPDRKEFDLYATMDPAKEVGGDFYDFFMTDDDHVALVIGDVSGKGVPAALFMVISKTLIKNYAMLGQPVDEVFTRANNDLCQGNKAELFTTAWIGIYEISTGRLMFADAGHETPLRLTKDGTLTEVRPARKKMVLAAMEDIQYAVNETVLDPGDMLLIYTDGVPEATDARNELYGMERLEALVAKHRGGNPRALLDEIHGDVNAFVGEAPQFDDLTMLAFEVRCR